MNCQGHQVRQMHVQFFQFPLVSICGPQGTLQDFLLGSQLQKVKLDFMGLPSQLDLAIRRLCLMIA
jgi:hypothetical protein